MQTKATIVILSISVYLLGLLAYSNHRSQQPLKSEALVLTELVGLADTLDNFVPGPIKKSAPTLPVEEKPTLVSADPLILSVIQEFNVDVDPVKARELAHLIEETAGRYQVDPLLVTALVSQESAFYADAVSPVGAIGLGQLMPYTAADLGVDPFDPAQNLDGCVRYLSQNLDRWAHTGDPIALALASYNAGPGAVQHYGGIPPYEETLNYVAVITSRYQVLSTTDYSQEKAS